MKKPSNNQIAIFLLLVVVFALFIAYIREDAICVSNLNIYKNYLSQFNFGNTSLVGNYIKQVIQQRINNSNMSVDVRYISVVNDLYRYNISVGKEWQYVYTTMDGSYLFIPYLNKAHTFSFEVIPLINTTRSS